MTTSAQAICVNDGYTFTVFDGTIVINSTFLHLMCTSSYCGVIHIYDNNNGKINISDSVFTNISSSSSSPDAGAVYYYMGTSGNGYYNINGNTFYDISTYKSVLVLSGTFSSLLFSYNTFYNVTSKDTEGGVFFFFFIFLFLFLFYFILFYCFYFYLFFIFILKKAIYCEYSTNSQL
jgi:hypothetical protein